MRTETTTRVLYQFAELDDRAKETAREWYRKAVRDDDFWSEYVIDDAKDYLKHLGFRDVKIYWSGFWSQGDGACFEGHWSVGGIDIGAFQAMIGETIAHADKAPTRNPLYNALDVLMGIAKAYPDAQCTLEHRGHYYHDQCVEFDCDFGQEEPDGESEEDMQCRVNNEEKAADDFKELSRDLMRHIYKTLEDSYTWHDADEQVDDNIVANEYEFTKDGRRA